MSQTLLLNAHMRESTTAMDAKWDESKHPRKHGQFAPKGTGTTGKSGGNSVTEKNAASSFNKAWRSYNAACRNDNGDKQKEMLGKMQSVLSEAKKIAGGISDKKKRSKFKKILSDMSDTIKTAKSNKGKEVEYGIGGVGYEW